MTKHWPCIVVAALCCLLAVATSTSAGGAWVLWMVHAWQEDRWYGGQGEDWSIVHASEIQPQCESGLGVYLTRRYGIEKERKENQAATVEYLPTPREPTAPFDKVHIRNGHSNPARDDWFTYLCLPDTVDPRGPKGGKRARIPH